MKIQTDKVTKIDIMNWLKGTDRHTSQHIDSPTTRGKNGWQAPE